MKTQEQIVNHIKEIEKEDFFVFEASVLYPFLDFEHAKPFLKPDALEENRDVETRTPAELIKKYMPFAWNKANNCRGLSASRSVEHMKSWLWLDSKEELLPKMDSEYEFYGKPCLVIICREYGIDWKKLDDGRWVNSEEEEAISSDEALRRHDLVDITSRR